MKIEPITLTGRIVRLIPLDLDQLADLTARPIGRYVMNPGQPNRAYALIQEKLDRSPKGVISGYGLKIYP